MNNQRKVIRCVSNKLEETRMKDLHDGDIFRLFNPDNTPVFVGDSYVFRVVGKPYLNEDSVWTVKCELL